MTSFSPETQRALEANGWREDRHIDTADYERLLRAAGYEDCQAACTFLQRYGDLALQIASDIEDPYLNLRLSVIMEAIQITPVSIFSDVVGRTLYIIGSCCWDFMPLLMDSWGRVYRITGGVKCDVFGLHVFLIAASGEEAIEKLVREELTGVDIVGEWIANGQWGALADGTRRVASRVNPNYS